MTSDEIIKAEMLIRISSTASDLSKITCGEVFITPLKKLSFDSLSDAYKIIKDMK